MLLHLKGLLTTTEVDQARALLRAPDTPWVDGRASAGGKPYNRRTTFSWRKKVLAPPRSEKWCLER
ncbi:hypothetical protein [Ottowia caeni]|uniref:hypothetical protein n=1 Tax=Ottowia caeni TaxID=2870339 RepID=UPI003D72DDF6